MLEAPTPFLGYTVDWATNAQFYHSKSSQSQLQGFQCCIAFNTYAYYDVVTSVNNQLVLARAFPIQTDSIVDFEVIATMADPGFTKGGRTKAEGTIMRAKAGVFRPAAINLSHVKNLGSTTVDVWPNPQNQTADVLVGGTASGAGTVNWHVFTTIRISGNSGAPI